MKTGFTEACS